jgi:hypothetical protein
VAASLLARGAAAPAQPSGANTGGIVSTPDSIALVLALLVILIRELKDR